MGLLSIQLEAPAHVAVTVRRAILEPAPMSRAMLLMYASHRLLRTACAATGDYDSAEPGSGTFDRLISHIQSSNGPAGAIAAREDVKAALEDLRVIAAELLTPEAVVRTSKEWNTAIEIIEGCLDSLSPLAVAFRTAVAHDQSRMFVWAGLGAGAVTTNLDAKPGRTFISSDLGPFADAGPALAGAPLPEPLIPFTGIGENAWETIDGWVLAGPDLVRAPVGPLSAAASFGRLLSWHGEDSWETANRLAAVTPGPSASDYLVLRTLSGQEWKNAVSLQKIADFVTTHADEAGRVAFGLRALDAIDGMEKSTGEDYAALTDLLVMRQQFQDGDAKAATLRKLANIYVEKIGDRTAAQLCTIKALEASPEDPHILADLMDLVGESAAEGDSTTQGFLDVAADLMRAASALGEHPGAGGLLKAAAVLYDRAGDADGAVKAHSGVLDSDPNAIESFLGLVGRMSSHEEVEAEARKRLRHAWTAAARGTMLEKLAHSQAGTGRFHDAAASIMEAATLLPETPEMLKKTSEILIQAENWPAVLGVLKRLAEIQPDPTARTSVRMTMADIALERMHAPVIALAALSELPRDEDAEVLRRLFSIHSELGMWTDAAGDLRSMAERTGSPDDWVALARICRDRLGDTTGAASAFRKALDRLEDGRLVDIALEFSDLPGLDDSDGFVTTILNRAVDAASDDVIKAGIFKKLGGFSKAHGSTSNGSLLHLEEALRLNPVDSETARKLAEIYLASDSAEKALSVLEAPARAAGAARDEDLEIRLRVMAAGAAMRCFDYKGAARHLRRVLELRPDDAESARRLARAETSLGNLDAAVGILESIPASGGRTSADAPLLRELGRALSARGDHAAALARLEEAWQLDSTPSEEIFRELAEAASSAGNREAMIAWLKRLIHAEAKSPQKFTDEIRLGDAVRAAGDPDGAIEWYMAASREDYSRKIALHKALEVAVEAGQHSRARNLLVSLTEEEQDDLRKSDYLLAAAIIARDHMKDADQAIAQLKEALAKNPFNEAASTALDEILLNSSRLEELAETLQLRARHYRVSGDSAVLLEVLRKLGDLYESGLHNSSKAAEVFRQILTVAPDDPAARKHLAYCLTRIPGSEAEALDALRSVVLSDPTSVDSYRAIRDLSILTSDNDMATRASSALIVLGQGDESDFHLASRNRAAALRLKRDQIPSDAFMRFIARGLDTQVARIFALLYHPVLKMVPFKTPADLGLSQGDRISMDDDGLFQNMADAVGRVFDMDLPTFWHARGTRGLRKAPFAGRAVLVGDDLVATRRGKDLRFSLARAVVSFMPGAELCGVVDAPSMRLFFLAALKISFPDYPLPADAAGAADFVPHLARLLKDQDREEIHRILVNFRKAQRPVDLPSYTHSIDKIAARAGLFMSADLEVAAARTLDADMILSDMEPEDRLVELCAWCVSADFSELKNLMIQS